MTDQKNKTVAFHTLGCKLNYSETSGMSRILENEGFEKKEFDEVAFTSSLDLTPGGGAKVRRRKSKHVSCEG